MKSVLTSVWFDVGGGESGTETLTLKPSSMFFDKKHNKEHAPVTAYTLFKGDEHDKFIKAAQKACHAQICQYDSHDGTIQFLVAVSSPDRIEVIQLKLAAFIEKHFALFDVNKFES